MRRKDRYEPLFSEREGLRSTPEENSIRQDAPQALRVFLIVVFIIPYSAVPTHSARAHPTKRVNTATTHSAIT